MGADRIIAGEWPEDMVVAIVKYENMWGGDSYGVIGERDNPEKYAESPSVRNPVAYWREDGVYMCNWCGRSTSVAPHEQEAPADYCHHGDLL